MHKCLNAKKMSKLLSYFKENVLEAGCDEAGRGCLAGPVFAAAVILSPDFDNELLDDSKKKGWRHHYWNYNPKLHATACPKAHQL